MVLSRLAIGALALVAAVAVAGQPARPARAAGATVAVANFSFTDGSSGTSTTTINVGDTVTWTWGNTSGVPHSTTSTSVPAGAATWDSGASPSPYSYGPVTFTVPGTYSYHCVVHPATMTGTIIVQAAATATAGPPTSTSVPATSTMAPATSTPPSATDTPVAAATSTSVAVASPSPVLIAPAPTKPSGGAASAATQTALPRSGDGASSGGSIRGMWLSVALAGSSAAVLATAAGLWLRRRAHR